MSSRYSRRSSNSSRSEEDPVARAQSWNNWNDYVRTKKLEEKNKRQFHDEPLETAVRKHWFSVVYEDRTTD